VAAAACYGWYRYDKARAVERLRAEPGAAAFTDAEAQAWNQRVRAENAGRKV
jgi:hypothetical protein